MKLLVFDFPVSPSSSMTSSAAGAVSCGVSWGGWTASKAAA